jgi:hypothetical protein
MKYLKRIFESLTEDQILELKEECETYLAYLLDDEDFRIELIPDSRIASLASYMDIDIRKSESANDDQFLWDDVKDQVIPLIELFRKDYFKYRSEKVILYFSDGGRREIRNDEDLDKVQTYTGVEAETEELICLTIKIKI